MANDNLINELKVKAYEAIIMKHDETEKVIQICHLLPDGPFHKITMYGSTILHKAAYSNQVQLVQHLLDIVFSDYQTYQAMLTRRDDKAGATILHEMATSDDMTPAAKRILERVPSLQYEVNKRGETPMFRAACFGKRVMFSFLHEEMSKENLSFDEKMNKGFLRRPDRSTILHMTVIAEHFELALEISTMYTNLSREKDEKMMTPLHILCCNPTVFCTPTNSGIIINSIYNRVSTQRTVPYKTPSFEFVRRQKQKNEAVRNLAKLLIDNDASWIFNQGKEQQEKRSSKESNISIENGEVPIEAETPPPPLMLAAKYGCMEIVKGILEKYQLAIEYEDSSGCNILHVALKHCHMEVFEYVEKMEVPMRWLIRKLDNNGNSILHMVGFKEPQIQDFRNPAQQLQDGLLLFERVKNSCRADYVKLVNSDYLTADKLFAKNNAKLHTEAKAWMQRTSENCSIVAVLIATVAFAAAYTVPGGVDDKTGVPILLNNAFFVIFAVADVLSITFTLTSFVVFLSILTSPFQMIDFKKELPSKMMWAFTLLILGVSMMMLAFSATIVLTIKQKGAWIKILLYSLASFPVFMLLLSYRRLYKDFGRTVVQLLEQALCIFPKIQYSDGEARLSVHHSSSFALEDEGYWV